MIPEELFTDKHADIIKEAYPEKTTKELREFIGVINELEFVNALESLNFEIYLKSKIEVNKSRGISNTILKHGVRGY